MTLRCWRFWTKWSNRVQYEAAHREDLAAKERFELEVIQSYLPAQLSEAEIGRLIETAVNETGAGGPQDMGKVMASLKPDLRGRADMAAVSAHVNARLTGR